MGNVRAGSAASFLSTVVAGPRQRRLAVAAIALSAVFFLAAVPFAKHALLPVPAFIPAYESAIVVLDAITAALLFGQYSILRARFLLILACGYLFTAAMSGLHALTFPGLFTPSGLLGASAQSTPWMYVFWHCGFPIFVMAYANARDRDEASVRKRHAVSFAILLTMTLVVGLTVVATAGGTLLPAILVNNHYTPAGSLILTITWGFPAACLLWLWRRVRSVLDLWLAVVLCAWVFDIALSAVLNDGRYDLGFYLGRLYGLLAVSFVLVVMLLENGLLYQRLVNAHERERSRSIELQRLNAEIEARMQERAAALTSLRDKEEELRAIVENLHDCVVTIDQQGIVRSINPAVERIFGYDVADVIGCNVSLLMPTPTQAEHDNHLLRYLETGEGHIIGVGLEVEGLHKNGERIALDLAVSKYEVKGQCYFVGILHDMRENKRLIEDLIQAQEEAEKANHAKADFLAAMSHEIRTPMNGVIGMIDVLHQSSLKGYQVEMVDLIRDSAYSLLTIIDDILDFSKIEAGRLAVERVPMELPLVIERACGLLDSLAIRKGVELTLFISPSVPTEVLGDALRLRQILLNLVNNAIKFSANQQHQGRVALRVHARPSVGSRIEVVFQVCDNGIGMNAKALASLFKPFAQADVSTTRHFGGTGLGLAIAGNLAALSGGSITVDSLSGIGSTFTMCLPFEPVLAPISVERSSNDDLRGVACLLVGNANGLIRDWAEYLRHDGMRVDMADSIDSAAAIAVQRAVATQVWVVDAAGEGDTKALLASVRNKAANLVQSADIRVVLVGRGHHRRPHMEEQGAVLVDGNVLSAKVLKHAIALAMGQAQEEVEPESVRQERDFRPPSRTKALQQRSLILVAEDNETNQKVILRQLALLGYAADVASDGLQALQCWMSGDYAMVFTDLHMPFMDGYQLTEMIRTSEMKGKNLPIIALTANALRSESERCRAIGMDDYLSKPAQLADLKAVLDKWLPLPVAATAENMVSDPVDPSVLAQLVGDDPAVLREFLQDFRSGALQSAEVIRSAYRAGELLRAGAEAHKLKSSARSVGARALADLSAELERVCNMGAAESAAGLLAAFNTEMSNVDDYLARLPMMVTE